MKQELLIALYAFNGYVAITIKIDHSIFLFKIQVIKLRNFIDVTCMRS